MDDAREAISGVLRGPFVSKIKYRTAVRWFDRHSGEHRDRLRMLQNTGELEVLERFLLSYLYWQLVEKERTQNEVLTHELDSAWEHLPEPMSELRQKMLDVVSAAKRTKRQLEKVYGDTKVMKKVRAHAWKAAFGDTLYRAVDLPEEVIRDLDVLILGETGSGKERIAQAIMAGKFGAEPPETVERNAAGFARNLLDSELFGHVEGAFTGASRDRAGAIASSDGGCLFLDEVADLAPATQVKLLRVLETDEVRKVGGDESRSVDVRYISATSEPIERKVENGDFRRDLFERLAGFVIRIPPLRQQGDEIARIGMKILDRWDEQWDVPVERRQIKEFLESRWAREYGWPGNVRELQSHLRRLILGLPYGERQARQTGDGASHTAALPEDILNGTATEARVKRWYAKRVYEDVGEKKRVAHRLDITRGTLDRRLHG